MPRASVTICQHEEVVAASGVRISWTQLPARVRAGIEAIIGGGVVVTAVSQSGGFSPGTADRVVTANGRRAFVKAVSSIQNERSPSLHRAEANVVGQLPSNSYVPALLGVYDDRAWVGLVFEDLDGHTPALPWNSADLEAAMTTLRQMAREFTPNPVPDLPSVTSFYATVFAGWERIRTVPPADLDPWARHHLDDLCRLAARGLASLAGDSLLHTDIRADNLLIRTDGTVAVVDWPWACTGAAWFDQLLLCVNVDLYGGYDPEKLVLHYLETVNRDDITAVLAGLCGYFTDVARQPLDAGLPTVRAFQRAQARSTLSWLRRRCST
jgi:Ser/Thr protein kinase RdoA (MazF antagonist)